MKKSSFNDTCYYVLFGSITAVAILLYIALLGGNYIWEDEAYTLVMIRHTYAEICAITAADVHPPLYYILLKFFIQPFGYSELAAKIFSIVPYIIILAVGGTQLKKIFNNKTAIVFMILFVFFPFLLSYVIEIRMYSLAAMFVSINGIYAYQYYERNTRSDYWIMIFSGAGASYTHYFAMVSVGIIYLLLLIAVCIRKRKLIKYWFAAILITAVLYLPWLNCFMRQLVFKINNDYWIPEITRWTLREYAVTMFSASGFKKFEFLAWCSYLTAFFSVILSRSQKAIVLSLCSLSVPAGTILIGIAVSRLIRPVFVIRYVIPATPLLIVFMAIGLCQMRSHALSTLIVLIALVGGFRHYQIRLRAETAIIENALDRTFTENCPNCDSFVVLAAPQQSACILAYYAPGKTVYINRPVTAAEPYENLASIDDLDPSANKEILLLVYPNCDIPDLLSNQYDTQYLQTSYDTGSLVDIYLLTHK